VTAEAKFLEMGKQIEALQKTVKELDQRLRGMQALIDQLDLHSGTVVRRNPLPGDA